MTKIRLIATISILAVFAFGASANAGEITFNGLAYDKNVNIRHDGLSMQVRAGMLLIEIDNDNVDRMAYCVDLDHSTRSQWTATFAPVSSIDNGLAAAYLYDHFAGSISSDLSAAGLQVAIWEAVKDYDSGLNLSAGSFRLNGSADVRNAAAAYLAALPGDLSGYSTSSFVILSSGCPQSQTLIVPEAGTIGLLTFCVLPLLIRRLL